MNGSREKQAQVPKADDPLSDDERPEWQATLRADARTRGKALSNSLANAIDQLRGAKGALARAEEQNQRLEESLSDARILAGSLTRRLEALGRARAESTSVYQKELARLSQQLADAIELACEEKSARTQAEYARDRLDELKSIAEADKRSADRQLRALQAVLDAQAESLALADRRIRDFVSDRASWRNRFGELLGVRRSATYRQLTEWRPQVGFSQSQAGALRSSHSSVEGYSMQSPAPADGRNPYQRANSLAELLSWDDVNFVRCAFVTVLGRQPDPEGEATFTRFIRRGGSKLDMLWRLRRSPEGENHDPGIAGLDRALRRSAWGRTPFVGPIVRLFTRTDGNTLADRRHRSLLNQIGLLRNDQAMQRQMLDAGLERIKHLSGVAQPMDVAAGADGTEATRRGR